MGGPAAVAYVVDQVARIAAIARQAWFVSEGLAVAVLAAVGRVKMASVSSAAAAAGGFLAC